MLTINIHEAKTHRPRFIEQAAAGEEIIIAKAGKPVAKLVPLHSRPQRRKLGIAAGEFTVPDDFDAPLPDDVLQLFEIDFARINARNIFPIDRSAGPAAETITYRQFTKTGLAKIISDYANDIPLARVTTTAMRL